MFIRDHQIMDTSLGNGIPAGPFFSPVGDHLSYWKCDGSRWAAVVDGNSVGLADRPVSCIQSIAVSASGHVAYAGHKDGAIYVVVDGEEQGPFDAVGSLIFSPDGERLAFVARRNDEGYLILDGTIVAHFEPSLPEEGLYADYVEDRPSFGRDGSSLACVAKKDDKMHVICNGEYGPPFVCISGAPKFSATTGSLVYGCAGPRSHSIVINHVRGEVFERIWSTSVDPDDLALMWQPTFSADGTKVVFGALAEGELLWRAVPC
jgi:WD40-like Beta Propeller Repeat